MRSYIVDTYAWISYFEGRREFKNAIEENELYTPSIVLAEISRILSRKKVATGTQTRILGFVKAHSLILKLDETNAAEAGVVAEREGLSLIDGIIYSYTSEGTPLLTGDRHFRSKPNVDLIEGKR